MSLSSLPLAVRLSATVERLPVDAVRCVLALGPALALLPVALTEPVGHAGWDNRTIAGFFQSLAFLEWGFGAVLQLHPEESLSSPFHLHSLLSAALLAAGFDTGGRVVSVATMALAAYWVGGVVSLWRTPQAGWVATALVWLQPWVLQQSYMWVSEPLSIALTTGVVYAVSRHYRAGGGFDYPAALLLAVLAVTTHRWEAIVGLPLVVVSLFHRDFRRAVGSAVTVFVATGVVWYVANLQGGGSSMLEWWGVWGDWSVLLTAGFWGLQSAHGWLLIGEFVYLPAGILGLLVVTALYWRRRTEPLAVLAAWLVAGLVIPIALARGNVNHPYLVWGLVAPVTVGAACLVDSLTSRIDALGAPADTRRPLSPSSAPPSASAPSTFPTALSVTTIGVALLSLALLSSLVYGTGLVTNWQHDGVGEYTFADESQRVGAELRERGIDHAELTFVGDWYQYYSWGTNGYQSDILFVYAGAKYLPPERDADLSVPSTVRAHVTTDLASARSEWCVVRTGDSLELGRCVDLQRRAGIAV